MLINHLIKISAQDGPVKGICQNALRGRMKRTVIITGSTHGIGLEKKVMQLTAGKINSGACIKIYP
jgi:hypothetical protein